jgi:hypothetical protein
MIISPRDVARLVKDLFAGLRRGPSAKPHVIERRRRDGSR